MPGALVLYFDMDAEGFANNTFTVTGVEYQGPQEYIDKIKARTKGGPFSIFLPLNINQMDPKQGAGTDPAEQGAGTEETTTTTTTTTETTTGEGDGSASQAD